MPRLAGVSDLQVVAIAVRHRCLHIWVAPQ